MNFFPFLCLIRLHISTNKCLIWNNPTHSSSVSELIKSENDFIGAEINNIKPTIVHSGSNEF